jgi:hypothetical protein
MNLKKLLIYGFVFMSIVLIAGACTRKNNPTSISDVMPGKWLLTMTGSDDNLNGVIDHYERHNVAAGMIYEMVFDEDGTGVQSNTNNGVKSLDLAFSWRFLTYDSLRIMYAANDTITYYVSNSSSVTLGLIATNQIENSDKVGREWLYFQKK